MAPSSKDVEDLRRRFGAEIPIIDRIPSPGEVVEQESWLERISGTVGLEKWMWKSRRGLLIAIIVVPPGVGGLVDFWAPPIRTGIDYARTYISIIERISLSLGRQMVAFLPEPGSDGFEAIYPKAILAPSMGQPITASSGLTDIDVIVYRLYDQRFDPLDGRGPSRFGGRWNSPGPNLLYASDSILAAVEELKKHLPLSTIKNFMLHEIRIAALAEILPMDSSRLLISGSFEGSRSVGDDWVKRNQSDVLVAPSRVDPSAHTVIVNLSRIERMKLEVVRSSPINIS